MSKKILIDTSNGEETRVAVTENGKLDNFEIESNKKTAVKGDVYLAKITRIEPSLQSAFVDFGTNRNGFLPLTEIHPDYFKIPSADQNELSKLTKKLQNIENINDKEEIINGENSEISNDESKLLKNLQIGNLGVISAVCNITAPLARSVFDLFKKGIEGSELNDLNIKLCGVRAVLDSCSSGLISAIHFIKSLQNKKYETLLPPLMSLSLEEQKALLLKLKKLDFVPKKNIAA